ncbi:hypothetical protein K491DRAFT_589214 [Lophiostoma macrostomum CBS 122681]|uniref:HAD-like protein n=1 Tax=Lophiostoma macrostomum CBS 122681 TaxID=1314788 RepID=A0A6A6TMX9_9PLEO|nr:hypothetical protein K491DRAFT_589214 [Lophiostoma macrostomum CBS 122681]
MQEKKNLLIAFDAFGTLFHPRVNIAEQYRTVSREHGIVLPTELSKISSTFGDAFKTESTEHPNYGKAFGIETEKWWGNVITKTLTPFLTPSQTIPPPLIAQIYHQFSSKHGYSFYSDVLPIFSLINSHSPSWKWDKTIIGVITNSDNRVPSVLESLGLSVGPRRFGSVSQQRTTEQKKPDIDFVVLSYDVESAKPDRKIFDAGVDMLRDVLDAEADDNDHNPKLSVKDFEKLYVGDEIDKDYLGAERAGWNALYLKRKEGKLLEPHGDGIEEMDELSKDENGNEVVKKIRFITHLEQLQHWGP